MSDLLAEGYDIHDTHDPCDETCSAPETKEQQ